MGSFQKVRALLHGQTFSAFGSSSFEDLDTPARTHSCPEAMSPRPSDVAWLIRSFHGVIVSVFWLNSKENFNKRNLCVCQA